MNQLKKMRELSCWRGQVFSQVLLKLGVHLSLPSLSKLQSGSFLVSVLPSCHSFSTSFKMHHDKSPISGKSILYLKILNRHQTEEWKGWMQVLFQAYHYFAATEIYNAIRLSIAVYVWI